MEFRHLVLILTALLHSSVLLAQDQSEIRVSSDSPPPEFASMPNGKEGWVKMIEHVPEFPETFLTGKWVTVPEEEAWQFPVQLALDKAQGAAALTGKNLSDEEAAMIKELAGLNRSTTILYSGHLVFGKNRVLTGHLKSENSGKETEVEGDWLFEPANRIQTRVRGGLFNQLTFSKGQRLVFCDRGILIVLKKE